MWLMVFARGRMDAAVPLFPPAALEIEFFLPLAPVAAPLALSRLPRGRDDVFPV